MITEDELHAAAGTIDDMPPAELRRKFAQLKDVRANRTKRQTLRQQAELDSMELDEAAYRLGSQAQQDGDLLTAVRWLRAAALNDFADAPLRLAKAFDSLARQRLANTGTTSATHDELHLVIQAARWYLVALAAGDIEADELLEVLLARHDPSRRGPGPAVDGTPAGRGRPPGCPGPTAGARQPEPLAEQAGRGTRARRALSDCESVSRSRPTIPQ